MTDTSPSPASPGVTSAASRRGPLLLQVEDLCKDYHLGGGEVLRAARDVSFGLYRKAVVAIVGESGSGKSTTARLLALQERATSGRIIYDGQPVHTHHVGAAYHEYKSNVQMVFQDPFASLNPVHRVRTHLEWPVTKYQGKHGAARREEVNNLLRQVRLLPPERFADRFPHELSGGQRQRVSIARALSVGPQVLLADEPVSMLDVSIRLELLSLIDDLRENFELAVLYITHDIASARYFADEILVMYAGQVVERGPAEQVTQAPAHPYTQLLIASAPDPDALGSSLQQATSKVRVQSTSALASKQGCSFSARCPFATQQCHDTAPPTVQIGDQRSALCWHLDAAAPELVAGGGISVGGASAAQGGATPLG